MSSMSGNNLPQPIMLERSPQSATATAVPSANIKIYNSYRIQSTGGHTKLSINLRNLMGQILCKSTRVGNPNPGF